MKRPGLRPGSVLNILFCFVSFWPIGTEANFGHGDRRAHLQNTELTESCYSHREAVRTRPCLGEEVSSRRFFYVVLFFFFFLGGIGRITLMEKGGKEGQVESGEEMLLDHQADGGSVGGKRCKGRKKTQIKRKKRDSPGGPVVKTLRFHCRRRRFDP